MIWRGRAGESKFTGLRFGKQRAQSQALLKIFVVWNSRSVWAAVTLAPLYGCRKSISSWTQFLRPTAPLKTAHSRCFAHLVSCLAIAFGFSAFPLVLPARSVIQIVVSNPFRLGVLGSGKGSNFVAIANAVAAGRIPAEIALVLSDVEGAGILAHARERKIPAQFIPPGKFRTKLDEDAERAFVAALQSAKVDLIVLAGFMRVLKGDFLRAFEGRIVNIHPSLLPSFPGLEAWKQALDHGVKVTGCTVHFVDAGVDAGPIIGQQTVPVLDNDTPESLHQRIHAAEHELYPHCVAAIARGEISVTGRRVVWKK